MAEVLFVSLLPGLKKTGGVLRRVEVFLLVIAFPSVCIRGGSGAVFPL